MATLVEDAAGPHRIRFDKDTTAREGARQCGEGEAFITVCTAISKKGRSLRSAPQQDGGRNEAGTGVCGCDTTSATEIAKKT